MDRLGQPRLPVDQGGAVEGGEQPLVGIDHERVDPLDAAEALPDRRGEQCGAAVGAVHVEPELAFLGHVGHAVEVVDDAGVGGAPGGHHGDDVVAPRVGGQRGPQGLAGQAMVVDRHEERFDAEDVQRLAHRRVGLLADGHHRSLGGGVAHPDPVVSRPTMRPDRLPAEPAGHEAAAGTLGQTGQVGQDPEGLVLGRHRPGRLDPRRPLERRAGHDHVEQQRGLGRRGRDEGEELGAVHRDGGRGQLLVEHAP